VEVNAQDVTFLGGGNDSGGSSPSSRQAGSYQTAGVGASKPQSSRKQDDVVIEDISDEPINLDDIPF
jgi:single-stranded DNA-binding protein